MSERWDVIIVGARCAGASLAAHLARSGARVLVLDADRPGTDQPMSTHFMQPTGMRVLDRLGVADRIRQVTPASHHYRVALDDVEALVPLPEPGYAVRRYTLDPLLQDVAEHAGAELRFRHKVVELVRTDERVSGVVAETPNGRETFLGDLVVGADGMYSTVAKLTNAELSSSYEADRAGYWSYYPAPRTWTQPWDAALEYKGRDARFVFRTNDDLVLLAHIGPADEVRQWGKESMHKLRQGLETSPMTAALCAGKEPVGRSMGLLHLHIYYRQAAGPGWALVGDAGHFTDVTTGQGMSDALIDAERLAAALQCSAREEALEHYWRTRDLSTLGRHFDSLERGQVAYNSPLTRWLVSHIAGDAGLLERIGRTLLRELEPQEAVPLPRVLGMMLKALLYGRFDVLRGFGEKAASAKALKTLAAERRALLDAAETKLHAALAATKHVAHDAVAQVEGALTT